MIDSVQDAERQLEAGPSMFGPGWREVSSLEDLSDDEQYTSDEEEIYAVLDLGSAIDRQTLQTESTYQLIGIDTPVPFLKFGNQVYQGEMTPLIGDEVILGMVRNPANPTQPSHPPLHVVSHHLTFRPITLYPKGELPPVLENRAKWAPAQPREKKTVGRPKGATTRPKLYVENEEAIRNLDLASLPENVIIEMPAVPDPANQHTPLSPVRISKAQAERVAVGLPARSRGPYKTAAAQARAGPSEGQLEDRVFLSQVGRRAREREEAAQGESSDAQAKGKGRARESTAAVPVDGDTPGPADFTLGGLTLTARDLSKPQPKQKRRYTKKVIVPDTAEGGSKRKYKSRTQAPAAAAGPDPVGEGRGSSLPGDTADNTDGATAGRVTTGADIGAPEEGGDMGISGTGQGDQEGKEEQITPASPLREMAVDER